MGSATAFLLQEAALLHRQGALAEATSRYHQILRSEPANADALYHLAVLACQQGRLQEGVEFARRALLIDPRILILDEATSSVDTQTEREIQQALENLTRGRTTIAIAHRLSTLRRADRLVGVERGQIAEIGRHDELLEKGGSYARLHQAQLELVQGHAV